MRRQQEGHHDDYLLEDRKGSLDYPVERKFSDEDIHHHREYEVKNSYESYGKTTSNSKAPDNNQNKDLVEQLAAQKKIEKDQERNRRVSYQIFIFSIAFALNFFNNLRQQYIYEIIGCFSTKCRQPVLSVDTACDSFRYSITISGGIGFIFLGNIYDNIDAPRQVTAALLCILSLIALVEAIFSAPKFFENSDLTIKQVVMTLYQMSSVFEAGISLACIVIIHNWFKETVLGVVCACWLTATYI